MENKEYKGAPCMHGRNSKGVEALASQQKFRDEAGRKVGRNDPCPCGSGKKFKKCHGVRI